MEAPTASTAPTVPTTSTMSVIASTIPSMLCAKIGMTIQQILDLQTQALAVKTAADTAAKAAKAAADTDTKAAEIKAAAAKVKADLAQINKSAEALALKACCETLKTTMKDANADQKKRLGEIKVVIMRVASSLSSTDDCVDISDIRILTSFFCGQEALAKLDAELNKWATTAVFKVVNCDGNQYNVYLVPETDDTNCRDLPPDHPDHANPRALVVHYVLTKTNLMQFVHVYQQNAKHRAAVESLKSALTTKKHKSDDTKPFNEEDAELLAQLKAESDMDVLPVTMAQPTKLQWVMADDLLIAKNANGLFNTIVFGALVDKAHKLQKAHEQDLIAQGEELYIETMSLNGNPSKRKIIEKMIDEIKAKGDKVPDQIAEEFDGVKKKRVPGSMITANLSHSDTIVLKEALSLFPERCAAFGDIGDVEKVAKIADILIAEKLAEEQAAAKKMEEEQAV